MSTLKSQLKNIRIIHAAIVVALCTFTGLAYLFQAKRNAIVLSGGIAVTTEFALIAIISLISLSGYLLFKKSHKKMLNLSDNGMKMDLLRKALIIQYAIIEAAVIFSLICFIVYGIQNFVLFPLLLIAYLIYLRPHNTRVIELLKLDGEEAAELNS